MSWLQQQKTQADKEKSEREAHEAAEAAANEARHQSSRLRAQRECAAKFGDLEGKMCYAEINGKQVELGKFHSVIYDSTVTFFAGGTMLGKINYWEKEEEQYNRDDMLIGTGKYYNTTTMWLYLPYTKKDGRKADIHIPQHGNIATSYYGIAYDEHLAEYLLNFVKL